MTANPNFFVRIPRVDLLPDTRVLRPWLRLAAKAFLFELVSRCCWCIFPVALCVRKPVRSRAPLVMRRTGSEGSATAMRAWALDLMPALCFFWAGLVFPRSSFSGNYFKEEVKNEH